MPPNPPAFGPGPHQPIRLPMVGVDLGATGLRVGVVDAAGRVLARHKQATPKDPGQAAQAIAQAACTLCANLGLGPPASVGLGVPGPVVIDPASPLGRLTAAINLGWQDVPLAEMVRQAIAAQHPEAGRPAQGPPVVLINDVNAAALAEQRLGAARDQRHALAIWVGTGIGGGAVLDGRVFLGVEGLAAEVGHLVIDAQAPPGRRTLEQRAARPAIVAAVQDAIDRGMPCTLGHATPQAIAQAYLAGDPVCVQAVEDALALIGSAAAGLCAVLGPSVVVLGGAMIDALGPPAAHLAERSANRDAFPPGRRLSVRLSALGEDAGLIGSALYAAESPAGQPPQAGGPSPPRPPHAGPAVP